MNRRLILFDVTLLKTEHSNQHGSQEKAKSHAQASYSDGFIKARRDSVHIRVNQIIAQDNFFSADLLDQHLSQHHDQ